MDGKKRCFTCGVKIKTMIFRGSGYCSDRCRKQAMADAAKP